MHPSKYEREPRGFPVSRGGRQCHDEGRAVHVDGRGIELRVEAGAEVNASDGGTERLDEAIVIPFTFHQNGELVPSTKPPWAR